MAPARPLVTALLVVTCTWAAISACDTHGDGEVIVDTDPEVIAASEAFAATFVAGSLASGTSISTVECTLSGGTSTTCYKIEVAGVPADHEVGPFCPRNISDGADVGGLWIEDGKTFDLDGAFIEGLAGFYGDDTWQLYDESTGDIRVTDSEAACNAAARPDVDEAYQNHCVECDLDYVGGGVTATYLIPVTPVALASNEPLSRGPGPAGGVGVSLSGVSYDPPAPVDAILAAYTIAAFDDCGGHINPFEGYHYHAATGCAHEVAQDDGHAPLIGYAMDGYGLFATAADGEEAPTDLDECRGHTDETRGYHYHVYAPGENAFIGCFHGEQGSKD